MKYSGETVGVIPKSRDFNDIYLSIPGKARDDKTYFSQSHAIWVNIYIRTVLYRRVLSSAFVAAAEAQRSEWVLETAARCSL